jgi:hypothetical protein
MTMTADEALGHLHRLRVDPSAPYPRAGAALRADGLRVGEAVARAAFGRYREESGLDRSTGERVEDGWVSRLEAQRRLGLSRAQVDNLRRAGKLESRRNPETGRVRVSVKSIKRLLTIRTGA